jgi:DHA1 family bicyclomycin/chloramphenicol resistance-like MFS transporter
MSIGAFTSALVSILNNHTALPMTGVMACCAIGSFSILNIGTRMIRYHANIAAVEQQSADMISKS